MEKRKKRNKCRSGQRGVFSFFFIFGVLIVALVIVFAFFIPVSLNVQTKMYAAGENQMQDALETANGIQDSNARTKITDTINASIDSQQENIDATGFLIQYGWVFVVIIVSVLGYLYARSFVETQPTGAF